MRYRVEPACSCRDPSRVPAGAALAVAVLIAGSTACTQHGDPGGTQPGVVAPPETPPPVAGPAAPPMPASEPVTISIPSLEVTSEVIGLGLRADGSMVVPPGAYPAGWYTGAPTPGELGPSVVTGHVDWGGDPGVFVDLHTMQPGDDVLVRRRDGTTARFEVHRVARHPKERFPTEAVYGNIDHAGLRLITCGGEFDESAGSYQDSVVVYARLAGASRSS